MSWIAEKTTVTSKTLIFCAPVVIFGAGVVVSCGSGGEVSDDGRFMWFLAVVVAQKTGTVGPRETGAVDLGSY